MNSDNLTQNQLLGELKICRDCRTIRGREDLEVITKEYENSFSKDYILNLKRQINSRKAAKEYRCRQNADDRKTEMRIYQLMRVKWNLKAEKARLEEELNWFRFRFHTQPWV